LQRNTVGYWVVHSHLVMFLELDRGGGEADLHTKRFQLPKSPNPHRQIEPNGSLVHS